MPDQSDQEHLKIGEFAERCGLSERTVRHYESLGVFNPLRTEGGTRLYSEDDIEIGLLACRMRELDIPVDVFKNIATERSQHSTGDASSAAVIALLSELATELDDRVEKTLILHDEIKRTIKQISRCKGCKNKPEPESCTDCPLENLRKPTSMVKMIWPGA